MKVDSFLRKSWLLCFLLLGVGQILPFGWWYFRGISFGDGLFLILSLVEIFFFIKIADLKRTLSQTRFLLVSVGLIVLALGLGVVFNYREYINFRPEFMFWILRLVYFAFMIFMTANVVARRLTVEKASKLYLIGLIGALLLNALEDFVWSVPNERCGLYIWSNPNVIGNIAGIGLLYMVIWLKEGARPYVYYVAAFLLLSYSALFSFSKASWIMLALGSAFLLFISCRAIFWGRMAGGAGIVAIATFGFLLSFQWDRLDCYVNLKIKSSPPSIEIRQNYAMSALNIFRAHPVGIGVGRYVEFVTGAPVSASEAAQVGYSSAGNPHSAILYLMITGGWGALLGFFCLVSAVALAFWRSLELTSLRGLGILILILSGSILLMSALFQLQILTQNFLYVLSGILSASKWKSLDKLKRLNESGATI